MNLTTAYPGNTLFLKLKGEEKTNFYDSYIVRETDSQGCVHAKTIVHQRSGENIFFRQMIPIYNF